MWPKSYHDTVPLGTFLRHLVHHRTLSKTLNQAPCAPGFLKSFCLHVGMCVCLCVCVPVLRALITSGVKGVIYTGHVWLVKQVLQLFRILPLINRKGIALVTQYIMHIRQRCVVIAIEGGICINYLAVAIRRSISVIKVGGRMHSNKF